MMIRRLLAAVAIGIAAGAGGVVLILLLHFIQHLAFGYDIHALLGHESFLEGVSTASPLRRFLALCACAILTACGWWLLRRFARPVVSVEDAVHDPQRRMPFFSTCMNAILQIATVALGSPLGREGAPREVGAVLADWLAERFNLNSKDRAIMIACGAGAGLAAVYNVPLGGALFAAEVLLATFDLSALIPALASSAVAALVVRMAVGNEYQYTLPMLSISPSLIVWSAVAGPVIGLAAYGFAQLAKMARSNAPRNWHIFVWCAVVLPAVGLLAIPFPQVLGNGRGIEQLGLSNALSAESAAMLFLLKLLTVVAVLRTGAQGGMLTPGLALGGTMGVALGALWNHAWPMSPAAAFALIGSAAFLAASSKMPLTAIALLIEMTHAESDFLIPIALAVAGSMAAQQCCVHYFNKPTQNHAPLETSRS